MSDSEAQQRAVALAEAALDIKAQDLLLLELGELTLLADYFLLCSGTSDRHVRSVADRIIEAAKAAGIKLLHAEGMTQARWVLLDFGDVVVHVFTQETRDYYGIEELWADARRVPLDVAA